MSHARLHPPRIGETGIRRFHLKRIVDATGVSGTGIVAEGVRFSDGRAVLLWLVSALNPRRSGAMNHYDSIEELVATHGHRGSTVLVWTDEEIPRAEPGPARRTSSRRRSPSADRVSSPH